MLLLGFPRNRGKAKRDEEISQQSLSDRTTSPIGITVNPQLEIRIRSKKYTLPRTTFKVKKNMNSSIPVFLLRLIHEL